MSLYEHFSKTICDASQKLYIEVKGGRWINDWWYTKRDDGIWEKMYSEKEFMKKFHDSIRNRRIVDPRI